MSRRQLNCWDVAEQDEVGQGGSVWGSVNGSKQGKTVIT